MPREPRTSSGKPPLSWLVHSAMLAFIIQRLDARIESAIRWANMTDEERARHWPPTAPPPPTAPKPMTMTITAAQLAAWEVENCDV